MIGSARRGYGARVHHDPLVDLPPLRLAIRALPDGMNDADLVLAEAGALLAWAASIGDATRPWLVVDGASLAVGAEVRSSRALPPGLAERILPAGRYATRRSEQVVPDGLRRAAEALGATPTILLARIDEAGGAVVHVPAREE